jgi:HAD superfamily phosphatase (TIGR01668 family)
MKMIYPNIYVDSIHDIALEELKKRRIKGFILDLDNTITLWNSNDISIQVEEWFKKIKSMGFKACILSNNGEKRIVKVAQHSHRGTINEHIDLGTYICEIFWRH